MKASMNGSKNKEYDKKGNGTNFRGKIKLEKFKKYKE
jgi:hypothetical protein